MMTPTPTQMLHQRQLVEVVQANAHESSCPKLILPQGGVVEFNKTFSVTLGAHVTYYPDCLHLEALDPFYASTTVFVYVVALVTAISWLLLILLLINQRTRNAEKAPRSNRWLQGTAVHSAIAGRTRIGGLGDRPWLQKVAVLLVTLGLTVASVDTFKIAQRQHSLGITNGRWMRNYVVGSLEIRILRVVSGIFVWLAQVQTLIRLFPRRKEKLIIKWFGLSLILCDLIFSSLNSFWVNSRRLPRSYSDAIPALTYLFELAINLLYAAWVLYYVATKRRYAFFKADELSMSIVGALALTSIAIPVAFFIADISIPPVASWGDFFRWTGAAAASVVVWEWVERIEALEREEKKDGILGREVFDEDELHTTEPVGGSHHSGSSGSGSSSFQKEKGASRNFGNIAFPSVRTLNLRRKHGPAPSEKSKPFTTFRRKRPPNENELNGKLGNQIVAPDASYRPPTPPNREDTGSANSTIYAVHYHPVERTPPVDANTVQTAEASSGARTQGLITFEDPRGQNEAANLHAQKRPSEVPSIPLQANTATKTRAGWLLAANAFKRRKRSPPLEIKKAMQRNADAANTEGSGQARFDFRARLLPFASGKSSHSTSQESDAEPQHPTIIPAPPRGHTWSPDILRHSPNNLFQPTVNVNINPNVAHRRTSGAPAQVSIFSRPSQPNGERTSTPGVSLGGTPTANMMPPWRSTESRVSRTEQAATQTTHQPSEQPPELEQTEDQTRQTVATASEISVTPGILARERTSAEDDMCPDPG